jgi:hypothetical protein
MGYGSLRVILRFIGRARRPILRAPGCRDQRQPQEDLSCYSIHYAQQPLAGSGLSRRGELGPRRSLIVALVPPVGIQRCAAGRQRRLCFRQFGDGTQQRAQRASIEGPIPSDLRIFKSANNLMIVSPVTTTSCRMGHRVGRGVLRIRSCGRFVNPSRELSGEE